jgi:peptide/nickel transport system ATP-binding protein
VSGLQVSGLVVELESNGAEIVHDVTFAVAPREILGLVGESGCGKTTVALAIMGGTRAGATITHGSVLVDGTPMLGLDESRLQERRGKDVAYVSQDPTAALSPSMRIEQQLREMLEVHAPELDDAQRTERIVESLEDVRLPSDAAFLRRYPHQLSGGQQQRIAIAMAAILRPRVIVMDEPTTGLDVTTQAHILQTVRGLCRKHEVAIVYVSHDLAVVGSLVDQVLVMYAGRAVEVGSTKVLRRPFHPYARGLVGAIPAVGESRVLTGIPGRPPAPSPKHEACTFADRCPHRVDACMKGEPALEVIQDVHAVRCIVARELAGEPLKATPLAATGEHRGGSGAVLEVRDLAAAYGAHQVLHGVSLDVTTRECVALVGESGSGKTTLARAIIGLTSSWTGEVRFKGEPLQESARRRSRDVRQGLQYIFQSPYNSLNPRRTIGESIAGPLDHFFKLSRRDRAAAVAEALEQVSLSRQFADRYPNQLSGGERQRAAIARALVCRPEVLICDEVTSALDVSVQASIVSLLSSLREERSLAMLFVTHNLALVRSIADRVLVLDKGRIVESGPTADVLDSPADDYTRSLLADTPTLDAPVEGVRSMSA